MLEKPAIPESQIMACLRDAYGLEVQQLTFLPIGADRNTAVFQAMTDTSYFVKLRSGAFDEMTIIVPKLLHDQHIESIIAPLPTRTDDLWATLGDYKVMVFPFVAGHDGYAMELLDHHWVDFGRALKALHTAQIPPAVMSRIQPERYSDQWRRQVREFQRMAEETAFTDPVAAELAVFMQQQKAEISHIVQRAEYLASVMQPTDLEPFVLCHADIHAGNVLMDAHQRLYLVDWDTLILAPKERDLMFVGGGLFCNQRPPEEEERLFYKGYGQTAIDPVALAYYRYERIVQDIAAYCEQLLLSDEGGEDRANGLRQLKGQFGPADVIAMAYRSEKHVPDWYK